MNDRVDIDKEIAEIIASEQETATVYHPDVVPIKKPLFSRKAEPKAETVVDISLPAITLPAAVQRFSGEIEKNFETTANALEATAARLEAAATELRSRADDLRAAHPDVRSHVERWIQYERESNERGKFLNALFEK